MPWPFGSDDNTTTTTTTDNSKSRWWTVKTYHKKSCEQIEYFVQRDGSGRIKISDGFRWCTYNVETNDGEFPQFEFDENGNLDMNSPNGANIESSELVEMYDGGCWGDVEIEGIDDDEEVDRKSTRLNSSHT